MRAFRSAFVLLFVLTHLSGCARLAPIPPGSSTNDADLALALPRGVSMSTTLDDHNGMTVGQKLKELGAYVNDATLYDSSGKEIRFLQGFIGPPPGQEQQERERELREKYTVIDLRKGGA